MTASLRGPTLKTWKTQKWRCNFQKIVILQFFYIWKYWQFVTTCSWVHAFTTGCLWITVFRKKSFQNCVLSAWQKNTIFRKAIKLLYFDQALWPKPLTCSKSEGISWKTMCMCISFIWFRVIWNMSSYFFSVALSKWSPSKGSGRKWVIRPYPLVLDLLQSIFCVVVNPLQLLM